MDNGAQKSQSRSVVLLGVGLSMLLGSGTGVTQTNSPGIDLFALEGWWRYDYDDPVWKEGCNDTDNKYRVAIGRWEWDDIAKQYIFGRGSEYGIRMYDQSCILQIAPVQGITAVLQSTCVAEEVGEVDGLTIVRIEDADYIEVQVLPLEYSTKLVRCP